MEILGIKVLASQPGFSGFRPPKNLFLTKEILQIQLQTNFLIKREWRGRGIVGQSLKGEEWP
jgi:hypothetical protein